MITIFTNDAEVTEDVQAAIHGIMEGVEEARYTYRSAVRVDSLSVYEQALAANFAAQLHEGDKDVRTLFFVSDFKGYYVNFWEAPF